MATTVVKSSSGVVVGLSSCVARGGMVFRLVLIDFRVVKVGNVSSGTSGRVVSEDGGMVLVKSGSSGMFDLEVAVGWVWDG